MANTIRVKRRNSGAAGAPASLMNGELAVNEVGGAGAAVLYYGYGDAGSGVASTVIAIAGAGAYAGLTNTQTFTGTNTFNGATVLDGPVSGTGIGVFVSQFRLDELLPPANNIDWQGNRITGLADPVSAQDAATKAYVDAARSGLDVKDSARLATTANITLSGLQTIDGYSLISGDRVLVKNQTSASQNGLYEADSGGWTRSSDADTSLELTSGAFVFIEQGVANGGKGFVLTTANPITLGSTGLTWVQFSDAGAVSAGTALSFSGSTLNTQTDGSTVSVNGSNQLRVHTAYVGQTSLTTLGTITTGTWAATAVGLAYGGTGGSLSAAADGSMLKKSGTALIVATVHTDYLSATSPIDGGTF